MIAEVDDSDPLAGALLSEDAVARGRDGRWTLLGGACRSCGTRMFPRASVCPACMSEDVVEEEMPRDGSVYSFTVVHVGPERWIKPMTVGYVDLTNGARVFAHLRGQVVIGSDVTLALDTVGRSADGTPLRNFVFAKGERS